MMTNNIYINNNEIYTRKQVELLLHIRKLLIKHLITTRMYLQFKIFNLIGTDYL